MRRRALFAGLALTLLSVGAAHAQADWPAGKTIKIIVPFPPGGTVDIVTRLLTQPLGAALNTSVIIENKPGAGTNIGTELVARAAPDGLTLLMGGVPNAINETLYPNLNFNLRRDLAGVTLVASLPNVLVVNPNVPANTLGEFIALNKAKPGTINFASGGIGTTPHLCAVMFGMAIDAPVTHVPYRGSAPASQDLVAGQVQAMFDSVGSALPQIQAGRLRPLAVTGGERAALLSDVPTMGEGGMKDFVVTSVVGTDGASRDAARHRAEDRRRGGQYPCEPRSPENPDRARLRDAGRAARRRSRKYPRCRYRLVGEGGQAVRRDGELIGLGAHAHDADQPDDPRPAGRARGTHCRARGAGRGRAALHLRVAARGGARLREGPARARRAQGRQGRDPDGQQARMDRSRTSRSASLGGVMVAVNTWVTSRELQHILAHSDTTTV